MKLKFNVSGMHCKSCALLITDSLFELEGVSDAEADFAAGTVLMQCKDGFRPETAKKAIEAEGYKVIGWESTD